MSLSTTWAAKDPDDNSFHRVDWSAFLETGVTIAGSTWPDFPSGLVNEESTYADDTTTIKISGGTDGETYEVVNRITTSDGQTFDQLMKLKVKTRK